MIHFQKKILSSVLTILLVLLSTKASFSASVGLLSKLERVQENVSNEKVRMAGKHTVLSLLIECEFDEQCEIDLIPKLQEQLKTDPNPVVMNFLTYLKWARSDLVFNAQHCALGDKRKVRKVFSSCFKQWVDKEKAQPPQNRSQIDMLEYERDQCVQKRLEPLAKAGNLFAIAGLVNWYADRDDAQQMNEWSAKIEARQGTEEFTAYLKCAELP